MSLEKLTQDKVVVKERVSTWDEAIREASQPLLEQGFFNVSYVDAMIESVKSLGPYIVIAPEIAIAHARPSKDVYDIGISLLKLNQPINFCENSHYARLIFVISAIDHQAHLGILQDLAHILGDTEIVKELLACQNADEILGTLREGNK